MSPHYRPTNTGGRMSWYPFLSHTIPIVLNSASIIMLTLWYRKLEKRLKDIENALYIRQWLQAIQDGESPSDLAYMREKGFLR